MLSANDKQILENLKITNPDAYDLFLRTEAEHKEIVKRGCHDIRNIITVISGAYQLLDLTNKNLSTLPRWNQLGSDIKYLIEAFDQIGYYRYADSIIPEKTSVSELTSRLNTYNSEHYPNTAFIYSTRLSRYDIITDITKLFEAVTHLIDNAVEAVLSYNVPDKSDINISISEALEPHTLEISVENFCNIPDERTLNSLTEPFISNKSNRMGLGLAIAAKTIDALNGKLTYDFAEDSCIFKISIPYNC